MTDLAASLLPDQIANGHAFGSANGMTYGVFAEAPNAARRWVRADRQRHQARRRCRASSVTGENPTLRVKLTKVRILLTDFTAPPGPTGGVAPIKGEVLFLLRATAEAGSASSSSRSGCRGSVRRRSASSSATPSDERVRASILCGTTTTSTFATAPLVSPSSTACRRWGRSMAPWRRARARAASRCSS